MTEKHFDLDTVAIQAMYDRGFDPEFSQPVLDELGTIQFPAKPLADARDMRDRLWISIDNDDSLDLDQLTFAEVLPSGVQKMYVAVADVDGLVKKASQIDLSAAHSTTSIYTPTKMFPMLPLKLSTNLTSLNPGEERSAMVVEMEITQEGEFLYGGIYSAFVKNHVKLAYSGVAAWFNNEGKIPDVQGLAEQLILQDKLATAIKLRRYSQGALSFGVIELHAILENGIPVDLEETIHNRAHKLIENCMIAANVIVTQYLTTHNMPTLRRVVRSPERWSRIVALAQGKGGHLPPEPDAKSLRAFLLQQKLESPATFPELSLAIIKLIGKGEYVAHFPGEIPLGHFDLAELEYAHTTAPNRRYPDLIMQRLLKSLLTKQPNPYSKSELIALGEYCTQKEDDATRVERQLKKSAAAIVLQPHIGETFMAMVTGSSDKGTWVRLEKPPIEGKLVQGYKHLDVGDKIQVKLISVDVMLGYIDFVRILPF